MGTNLKPWLAQLLEAAEEEARWRGHDALQPEHLALATGSHPEARPLLQELRIDQRAWRDELVWTIGVFDGIEHAGAYVGLRNRRMRFAGHVQMAPETEALIHRAENLANEVAQQFELRHVIAAFVQPGYYNAAFGVTTGLLGLSRTFVHAALKIPIEHLELPRIASHVRSSLKRSAPALVMGGGGEGIEAAFQAVVDFAASERSKPPQELRTYLVFAAHPHPTDSEESSPNESYYRSLFQAAGVKDVIDTGWNSSADCKEATDESLADADIIYMGGGSRELLLEALAETPALELLVHAANKGAILVGLSAGATFLGEGWLSTWESSEDLEPLPMSGFVPDTIVVPHFAKPYELVDQLEDAFPTFRILGLPNGSVVAVHGPQWSLTSSLLPTPKAILREKGEEIEIPLYPQRHA